MGALFSSCQCADCGLDDSTLSYYLAIFIAGFGDATAVILAVASAGNARSAAELLYECWFGSAILDAGERRSFCVLI